MVVATYPGASASQIELEVADPLEKAIRTMQDVQKVYTKCYNDYATIEVDLALTTADDAVSQDWMKLRNKVGDSEYADSRLRGRPAEAFRHS